jgi:hypothetical protein
MALFMVPVARHDYAGVGAKDTDTSRAERGWDVIAGEKSRQVSRFHPANPAE